MTDTYLLSTPMIGSGHDGNDPYCLYEEDDEILRDYYPYLNDWSTFIFSYIYKTRYCICS